MDFILNSGTEIIGDFSKKPIENAAKILRRDLKKVFCTEKPQKNTVTLVSDDAFGDEDFEIRVSDSDMEIHAFGELGFVYGLLYISGEFMGIKPFWFWMDQKIEKRENIRISIGVYECPRPIVKYRGWFINDEVLIMRWKINGDELEPWKMAFEALLRCGGNMVIPGTDKNSKKYRKTAAEYGLWITHHHAEPLGAEMFARVYPEMKPNYAETPELFVKLWEDGVKEQKDYKVIWALGFRGQGDCPFWSNDTSGRFDTPQKRGKLISDIIRLQREIVEKYVKNPVFCTNLYGEIAELYDEGCIDVSDDIIKISADNGYGKMVTRRRDNHTVRISSFPKGEIKHGGIYYHVSFYDLQAANHITMFPNSAEFVEKELEDVTKRNMTDYWIINCSNIRPHTYFLDAIRRKWYGDTISDENRSISFANDYFGGNTDIASAYRDYHTITVPYGKEEDEHAGEQFYTENIRLIVHSVFNNRLEGTPGLRWLLGDGTLKEQIDGFSEMCVLKLPDMKKYYEKCRAISDSLSDDTKRLFDATIFLSVALHYCAVKGIDAFKKGMDEYFDGDKKRAFLLLGDSAELFEHANIILRGSEYGVWNGFYFNDCFADFKHTAYMIKKLRGYVRERGDNARHDKWYRDTVYAPEDRNIMTLLVNDNHMTDEELYRAMKKKQKSEAF